MQQAWKTYVMSNLKFLLFFRNLQITTAVSKPLQFAISSRTHCLLMASSDRDSVIIPCLTAPVIDESLFHSCTISTFRCHVTLLPL
jgi:hypothetical protein